MRIYSTEECEQWLTYQVPYYGLTKILMFKPEDNDNTPYSSWHVADISGKCFQHNKDRILIDIYYIEKNYPKLTPTLENLKILFCPRPSADTANACANKHYVYYFARSTQIPWCMTDYVTAHELGHTIQQTLCPEHGSKNEKFREYLKLRNAPTFIDSEDNEEKFIYLDGRYVNSEAHDKYEKYHGTWDTSPLEWFAEDFRWFFGVDKGDRYWGLPIPEPDERIKEFILGL